MNVNDIFDLFAETYAEAQAKFFLADVRAGGVTTNYLYPVAFEGVSAW